MNRLFKNITNYSLLEYQNFLNFHSKQYGLTYHLYTFIIFFLLAFLCISQFMYGSILWGFIFIIIIFCFIFYRYFSQLFLIKKEVQSGKISDAVANTFIFYENFFKVYQNKKSTKIKYWKLRRIFETKTHFYLYIDKTHAFILNKNGFSIGTCDQFSNFIKRKCWYKYKNKRR